MKKYILFAALLIPLLLRSQTVNLMPDSVWEDTKTTKWWANGTAFYNYNGILFAAAMGEVWASNEYVTYQQSLYPYFFEVNKDHKNEAMSKFNFGVPVQNFITSFGYPYENSNGGYYPEMAGQNFFFEYNGHLWYYQHVLSGIEIQDGVHEYRKDESYECFAEMNLTPQGNLGQTYYTINDPVPDVIVQGGFQLDSLMFFVGRNGNSASSDFGKWYLVQYSYDDANNKFVKGPYIYLNYYIPASVFGGCIKRLDSLQNETILINTYLAFTPFSYTGLLKPTKHSTSYSFTYTALDSINYNGYPVGAAAIMAGAIKGQKTSDANPSLNDRFVNLSIAATKLSDGKYPLCYKEYYISPDNKLRLMSQGQVQLGNGPWPTTYYLNSTKTTGFFLNGSYELIPTDFVSGALTGINGYKERLDFFYPDKKLHLNAAQFYSDQFKLNNVATVVSTDLDDTIAYPGIKSMWALTGIVDGAPPCSMNWHVWDSTLALNQHEDSPTEMGFITSQDSTVSATGTFEDQWSVGADMDFQTGGKSKKGLTCSAELKYFGAYEAEIQHQTTWKKEFETSFALHEYNQEQGCFIWTIPELTRYRYDAYPWWENLNTNNYPIPNSTQYLFRTTGMSTILEPVDLDKYPFYITDPNSASMASWKTGGSRDSLLNQTLLYGRQPLDNLSWTDKENGTSMNYSITNGTSSKYTYSNGFEEQVSVGMKIPKVFQFSVYESNELQYSTTVENETQFGNEIGASMKNLTSRTLGVNIGYLDMEVYWLYYDSISDGSGGYTYTNWWYYDQLKGMKPWYVCYRVITVNARIKLLSPENGCKPENAGLLFTWATEGEELGNFTFYISKSCNFSPSGIVYQQSAGDLKYLDPRSFKPEPGTTYYWRVSGKTRSGELVWSSPRSFTTEDKPDLFADASSLKALIYPNPGSSSKVTIAFSSQQTGHARCSVYEINGDLISSEEIQYAGSGEVVTLKPRYELKPGIYLVEISCEGERVVKKMVIM
ncbi:MAG: T9SS type A sorting domain-containing protein [Bacteroidetes bacterium]|nr:T9SS type A sorting domain-containing protein [Bacteroidota bacterium]